MNEFDTKKKLLWHLTKQNKQHNSGKGMQIKKLNAKFKKIITLCYINVFLLYVNIHNAGIAHKNRKKNN